MGHIWVLAKEFGLTSWIHRMEMLVFDDPDQREKEKSDVYICSRCYQIYLTEVGKKPSECDKFSKFIKDCDETITENVLDT